MVSKFLFLEFQLLLSRVAPYLQLVSTKYLVQLHNSKPELLFAYGILYYMTKKREQHKNTIKRLNLDFWSRRLKKEKPIENININNQTKSSHTIHLIINSVFLIFFEFRTSHVSL